MSTSKKKKSFRRLLKHKTFRVRNVLSVLCFILSIIFIIFLCSMNILPWSYILIISFILIIIDILGIIFINVHKKIWLKVIGVIILVLSIIGSSVGLYYLSNTNSFLNDSFTKKDLLSKNTYYVVSLKSNNYKQTDIGGEIGVYKETVNLNKALSKLNDKYSVKEKSYDDIGVLFESVTKSKDKFMLVEKASYEIVFSLSDTYNKADYDILYEFDVYTKKSNNSNSSTDKFNIYVGGTDFAGLMDFNMIITVNMNTHKMVFTSIPRDYYIEVVGKDGRRDKLSCINAYGNDVIKESIEKFFNIKIDYSIILDTNSLVEVVDYVGGIDFCSDYEFTTTHALVTDTYNDNGRKLHINKGCQHLDGVETLTVARERNAFPGRDRVRQKNCQAILISILKELVSTDTVLNYNETLNTISNLYETDIPKSVVSGFSKDLLNNGNKWTIETQSVDGDDDHDKVHLSNLIDWVMYPRMDTVDAAREKINETLK